MLAIPSGNQEAYVASTELPLELVDKESVENIREEIAIKLLSNTGIVNEENKAS